MNDLPAQSYIVGFWLHALNRIWLLFLAATRFEEVRFKDLMNGSCAWWVSGSGLFSHPDAW
jgi:hypothetical protein